MATQKKPSDPTEAALSAIEQALTNGFEGAAKASAKAGAAEPPRMPSVNDADIFAEEIAGAAKTKVAGAREAAAKAKEPALSVETNLDLPSPANTSMPQPAIPVPAPGTAANDDRIPVSALLSAIQAPVSRAAYFWAAIASLLWLAGAYAVLGQPGGYFLAADASLRPIGLMPILAVATAVIVPIILVFLMAGLHRRSREMHNAARAMGTVAARLAEPESIAAENIFSLGQAVRREVSSMGDGIERAISRAGELESLGSFRSLCAGTVLQRK